MKLLIKLLKNCRNVKSRHVTRFFYKNKDSLCELFKSGMSSLNSDDDILAETNFEDVCKCIEYVRDK